jgi:hypothetical protein
MYINVVWVMEGSMTGAVDSYEGWTRGGTLHLLASMEDMDDVKVRRRRPKSDLDAALRFIEWMRDQFEGQMNAPWCPVCASDGPANLGWAMYVRAVSGLDEAEVATVLEHLASPCTEHAGRSATLDLGAGWLMTRGHWMPVQRTRIRRGGRTLAAGREIAGIALRGADLAGAVLIGTSISDADMAGVRLRDADLEGASLSANLRGADLSGASLHDAVFTTTDLRGADLTDCDLRQADLTMADLRGADLSGARLCGAVLEDADLRGAVLDDADLTGADLTGADLTGADLTGADLTGADLTGVVGLT